MVSLMKNSKVQPLIDPMTDNPWRDPAEKPVRALDTQVGGGHYKDMKIQPIEFIVENNISYREGNAIKYICRHKNKNGVEDIKKAIHYLEMIKEEYENGRGSISNS